LTCWVLPFLSVYSFVGVMFIPHLHTTVDGSVGLLPESIKKSYDWQRLEQVKANASGSDDLVISYNLRSAIAS